MSMKRERLQPKDVHVRVRDGRSSGFLAEGPSRDLRQHHAFPRRQ